MPLLSGVIHVNELLEERGNNAEMVGEREIDLREDTLADSRLPTATRRGQPRSCAPCTFRTASIARWRSSPTSVSVSVRSGARKRGHERERSRALTQRVGAEHVERARRPRADHRPRIGAAWAEIAPAGSSVVDDEREVDRRRREP